MDKQRDAHHDYYYYNTLYYTVNQYIGLSYDKDDWAPCSTRPDEHTPRSPGNAAAESRPSPRPSRLP